MINLTEQQKDFISENTIKDSGVITFESYHSKCKQFRVTNINLNKQAGFYAERLYTLNDSGKDILTSQDSGKILDEYCKLMIAKFGLDG